MHSVLIATPTYEQHENFLQEFIPCIRSQTIPCDVVFVSTSTNQEFNERLIATGYSVLPMESKSTKQEKVIVARQTLIEHFLKGPWSHLFFVDTDIFLSPDTAQKLLTREKPIVSGVYLSPLRIGNQQVIVPVAYDFGDTEEYRRPIAVNQVLETALREVHSVGFGCCMIARQVLTAVSLRDFDATFGSEDIPFCIDARSKGFKVFLDTGTWVTHHAWPLTDKRNEWLTKKWNMQ